MLSSLFPGSVELNFQSPSELYNSEIDYIGLLAECEKVLHFISVGLQQVIYHAIHYIVHRTKCLLNNLFNWKKK